VIRQSRSRYVQDVGYLCPDNALRPNLIADWSTKGGAFPTLDAECRGELNEALAEARNKAAGAQRAIPTLEAEYARAANSANSITLKINANMAEIILEESLPAVLEIVAMKADIAERMAVASEARELSLRTVESIPHAIRLEVAAGYYRAAGPWERARVAAASPPAPSREGVTVWRDLAARLAVDASATVE
jgi:hypothetical protein